MLLTGYVVFSKGDQTVVLKQSTTATPASGKPTEMTLLFADSVSFQHWCDNFGDATELDGGRGSITVTFG